MRTNLNNGSSNNTLRSTFVNNTYTVRTKDLGEVPSRQSLSEILRPRADNGDAGGDKPEAVVQVAAELGDQTNA